LIGALLVTGCAPLSLDVEFGQGDDQGSVSQNNLFILMLVILFVMFALVLVSVTNR
jgi:hypothetical protein